MSLETWVAYGVGLMLIVLGILWVLGYQDTRRYRRMSTDTLLRDKETPIWALQERLITLQKLKDSIDTEVGRYHTDVDATVSNWKIALDCLETRYNTVQQAIEARSAALRVAPPIT